MTILEHYRCPEQIPDFELSGNPGSSKGFFRFGPDAVCCGDVSRTARSYVNASLFDAGKAVEFRADKIGLPFDADSVLNNLRYERYVTGSSGWLDADWVKEAYYRVRPVLPVGLRKHLSARLAKSELSGVAC